MEIDEEHMPIKNEQFVFMQIWGSYLMEYKHNTYAEIMNMNYEQMQTRFRTVTGSNKEVS